jgi:DNA-directed RNA polymerase specialized sigma54-like protein
MTMELELEQTLTPDFGTHQLLTVSPKLVQANAILVLSAQELQQAIALDLRENPALEVIDIPTCAVCGTGLLGSIGPRHIERQKSNSQALDTDGANSLFDPWETARRTTRSSIRSRAWRRSAPLRKSFWRTLVPS